MTVYHWLVVATVGLAIVLRGSKPGNIKYVLLMCILMFCVMGLRDCYTIGIDSTTTYYKSFNMVGTQEWKEIIGKGEKDLNIATSYLFKLIYILFDGNYQWVIIILAAFEMLVLAHFLRRYSTNPILSILCYFGLLFYTFMFSALKQSIAMAIILLAFDALTTQRPVRFFALVVIASQFHFPALIFAFAYPISKMNLDKTYWIALAGMLFITFLFRNVIVGMMTDVYENNIYDSNMRFLANKVLVMLGIVALGCFLRPPISDDWLYSLLIKIMGVAIILQTFASYNNTFERLADYYFQFSIIFIPMIFQLGPQKHNARMGSATMLRMWGPIVVGAFAIWRFLDYTQNGGSGLTPFYFYFNAPNKEEMLVRWALL